MRPNGCMEDEEGAVAAGREDNMEPNTAAMKGGGDIPSAEPVSAIMFMLIA